ncbi:MAG: beta-N-acetylhexosaminidase [Bacteroidetes bacterium]|nr:beta-N-acetylhexosaminidase [Bacteroidota bacterium]
MSSRLLKVLSVFLFITLLSCQQEPSPDAVKSFESIIPNPASAQMEGGVFTLETESIISVDPGHKEAMAIATLLAEKLRSATGYEIKLEEGNIDADFVLAIVTDPTLGEEGYELKVTSEQVTISANKPAGLFYGTQTLRQLFSDKIENSVFQQGPWEVATGVIKDLPSYSWRGSMLDVARHFFGVEDVKKYIDYISFYKMNILHLHLSDDQGWRIEIKSWPNLAKHGGSTQVGGGKGGYYTQEQYRDIVAYAAARYVTVIPEIDLPGHINSALASYGELNGGTVVPIEGRYTDTSTQGMLGERSKPTELYTGIQVGWSTLRVEKEESFKFVSDVLGELAAITPGPYLHIGGDEAHVTAKKDYITFINRFKDIVKGHNKMMVGWEEIAQGEIDSTIVAQYWANEKYARMAADKGAKIIMSPSKKVYLDMKYDSTTKLGLNWANYIETDTAYNWDPATCLSDVDTRQILGVEAPLWSETVVTLDDIEFLLFPRITAVAEIGWTPAAGRNWDSYKIRTGRHGKRWKVMGIDFYASPRIPWE